MSNRLQEIEKEAEEIIKLHFIAGIKEMQPGKTEEYYDSELKDFDTDEEGKLVVRMVKNCMTDFSDQRLKDYKEALKLEICKAMHDGILKYGVRVKPGAKDLTELIDTVNATVV